MSEQSNMADMPQADGVPGAERGAAYDAASQRVDAALGRLEASLRSLNGRVRSLARLETEARAVTADRARLAGELDRANTKARKLDAVAADTSRKLVEAMETVKQVLSNQDAGDA
jgi:ABC-type transporter Mla subunit MlaD